MTKWVFLSAHFDDVVLSTGGLVWELNQRGDEVEVWTICAGDSPVDRPLTEYAQLLHSFWDIGDQVPRTRSQEDAACCRLLGVKTYRRCTVPDNIYRYRPGRQEALILENEDQFKPLEPEEAYLIPLVADFIYKNMPEGSELVSPFSIGSHRDHVLTRSAAEQVGVPLWHYADYPYLIYGEHNLDDWIPPDAREFSLEISAQGLQAWQDGFACHRSQIPLLYVDEADMRESIEKYLRTGYGYTLWQF